MQVFVYEFVTGGGMWSLGIQPPAGSLLAEGRAMAIAVTEDLQRAGVRVRSTRDVRVAPMADIDDEPISSAEDERLRFHQLAAEADWTLVIAPESGGALLERRTWVEQAGRRALSPNRRTIEIASDKHVASEYLRAAGIATPEGMRIERDSPGALDSASHLFPAVLKPIDGCGSQEIRLLREPADLERVTIRRIMRLERFVPGLAASVAVLCSPSQCVPLPACQQLLSDDGHFVYRGGRLPLPEPLDRRARGLALAAAQSLPNPLGYVGVDLVLGNCPRGSEDYVIEINPRLTTSYVGLRALCQSNLAAAMIAIATGRQPALSWGEGAVQFSPDGSFELTRIERLWDHAP